jgi:hypothetical protein
MARRLVEVHVFGNVEDDLGRVFPADGQTIEEVIAAHADEWNNDKTLRPPAK